MDIILLIGQSNAKGCGNPEESVKPTNKCYEYLENFTGNALLPLGLTLQLSEGRGTIAPSLANKYSELTEHEVCIVHYAVDGSRIKNWNHDKFLYLNAAIEKMNHAVEKIRENYTIDKKYALWIQGESDGKYGTDPLYYKKRLIDIGDMLKEKAKIEKTFVSCTGYWAGDEDYLKRCERIAAVQQRACEESENLILISKMALTFPSKGLLQDEVHYSMEGLNILGNEIAENIVMYYNKKNTVIEDNVNLDTAREYIKKLEML